MKEGVVPRRERYGRKLAAWAGLAAVVYAVGLRPRLVRWGASNEEVEGPFAGAERVMDGERAPTMAITINAPPEQVWPWLVQLGWDRGGWYSWDRLDNAGRPSAQEVHPEWQDLAVGDRLKFWSPVGGVLDSYAVGVLEPTRFLGLYGFSDLRGRVLDPTKPRPSANMEALWGFQLKALPGGRTRLVISGWQAMHPRWLGRLIYYWLFPPVIWIMQARMLAVLKRNIERVANAPPDTIDSQESPPSRI